MSNVAELLIPAIRWDDARGYEPERRAIEHALEIGVGGFVLFGGHESEVRALTKELRQSTRVPLLIGAELERGAGQQFPGTTGLPPLAAIASLNDPNAISRAAKLTAREARTIGVNWGFAPVCDLETLPDHTLTGTSAPGADPERVGALAAAWIQACQHEGVLACARHFPGYGRATHAETSGALSVAVSRGTLLEHDLVPFRAAIGARVASMMTANASYPALDASHSPASFSTQIVRYLMREKFGFDGLVVSDALATWELFDPDGEPAVAIRALDAGCDLLLYPRDLAGVVRALEESMRDGPLYEDRIDQSRRRRLKWAQWAAPPTDYRRVSGSDVAWAGQLADRVIQLLRGSPPKLEPVVDLIVIDEDARAEDVVDSAYRATFGEVLRAGGVTARRIAAPDESSRATVLIALFNDVHAGKAHLRYAERSRAAVIEACDAAHRIGRTPVVVQFGPPAMASGLCMDDVVICAWSGEPCMQEAAARWLVRPTRAEGRGPGAGVAAYSA